MTIYDYIWILAILIYICTLVAIPFKIKKCGKSDKTNEKGFWFRTVLIFVFALALLILCKFFHFGEMQNAVLEGCSCFAVFIASKEIWVTEDS